MTSKEIVAALKTRRKKMRLTQEDWAAKSGITQERISDYERGKAIPGIDSANKLAKGLGLDLVLVVPKFDDDDDEL
jgi:transcriptional regulator with XRE-family HTH domain